MAADETKRVTKTKQAQVEPRREIKRHLRRTKSGGATVAVAPATIQTPKHLRLRTFRSLTTHTMLLDEEPGTVCTGVSWSLTLLMLV